jgi:cytoskeletal protein CcmA (bactofilin family)
MNFNKKDKKYMAKNDTQTSGVNTICDGATINGDIIATNDLRIDGRLNGTLETKGRVVVGDSGVITGDIRCNNVEVLGAVIGNIYASETVTLKAEAKMTGNITTKHFSVEPSITFNGFCKMGAEAMKANENLKKEVKKTPSSN